MHEDFKQIIKEVQADVAYKYDVKVAEFQILEVLKVVAKAVREGMNKGLAINIPYLGTFRRSRTYKEKMQLKAMADNMQNAKEIGKLANEMAKKETIRDKKTITLEEFLNYDRH